MGVHNTPGQLQLSITKPKNKFMKKMKLEKHSPFEFDHYRNPEDL